jgi:2-C-methyl-D-erythritol 4-phosphate cytidylyltransferase
MGFDKLFAPLAGKPVIAHSIAAFERCADIGEIILVTREDRFDEMRDLIAANRFSKVNHIIAGGAERHFSVWNGLQISSDTAGFVAIHDGARPLVTPQNISDGIALAEKEGASCLAAPVPDTLKRADADGYVTESVDRRGLWAMQTPQIFSRDLILKAYRAVIAGNELVTDEVSAVQGLGAKVALFQNQDWNFKITFPRDLELAEQVISLRNRQAQKRS